jgi:DNA-binding MarR family transcriptional regulator
LNDDDLKVKKAIEVLQSVRAIIKTITSFTQQNAVKLGLTLHQLSILNTLYSFPNLTLKEVTAKLHSSKSTISVSIERLVQLGLVKRKSSIEDR